MKKYSLSDNLPPSELVTLDELRPYLARAGRDPFEAHLHSFTRSFGSVRGRAFILSILWSIPTARKPLSTFLRERCMPLGKTMHWTGRSFISMT